MSTITRVQRDAMLDEVRALTKKMQTSMRRTEDLGRERRALLLRINRETTVTYTRLEHETGLSRGRLSAEVAKAKREAGVTDEHPRYPSFGRNGT